MDWMIARYLSILEVSVKLMEPPGVEITLVAGAALSSAIPL